jgi:hypothetical protein
MVSVKAPGVKGTTRVTGLVGNVSAAPAAELQQAAINSEINEAFILSPLWAMFGHDIQTGFVSIQWTIY